ncbi:MULTISPECIES: peptidylprolyl isomerase [Anaeromyxobacter]|uniref:peptidylprolyl isomerase n=1 Tax=Anaeromyxobacter TaxID=161492 RepID=UPI001F580860|nr:MULTISPECIES: peptidylprolyl isomerase [unclassified Anaeromyxobacter]
MLEGLRANKGGIITWIFLGAIIVVFVISFGPGSLSKGGCRGAGASYAAKVNGKTIPAVEWERQYGQLYNLYQSQMGGGFTRELAAQLGVADQALSQLVDRELVIQEAKRRGVLVSDAELSSGIHAIPAFQQNGAFHFETYEAAARQNFGSPAKFEAWYRDQLLYGKMLAVVGEDVKVSDAEVKEAWRIDADKLALTFVKFPLAAFQAEAKPSDAEVKAFAEKEGARIEQFYKDNPARFDQQKKVRVRHVLARVGPGADDAAAKKKIEEAAARVKKGEDFGKVVAALSDDEATKARGGELGFVTEGLFDEAFAKAALALEQGKVSEPVRSASGWHLVQAEEVVPAKKVSLADARPEIARELLAQERARKAAADRAQAALAAARGGKTLPAQFPNAKPLTVGGQPIVAEETGTFTASSPFVPKLGPAAEIIGAARAARAGEVLPKVFEVPSGPVVAVVTARETADEKAFEGAREQVSARLRNQKEAQVVSTWLETLRKGAKIERNIELLGSATAAR